MFFFRNSTMDSFVTFTMTRIYTIITNHFEMFFRYMADESFNEIECRNGFCYKFIIFMPVVMKGNSVAIVGINA